MRRFFGLLFTILTFALHGKALVLNPNQTVIVIPPKADSVVKFAAQELQRLIGLKVGIKPEISENAPDGTYPFIMGTPQNTSLLPEEARWEVTDEATRIYGDSTSLGPEINLLQILSHRVKSGDLTAVYDFAEKQLGFLFLAPGPLGTVFEPASQLTLTTGSSSWNPGPLVHREIRPDYSLNLNSKKRSANDDTPDKFKLTTEQNLNKYLETHLWLKQQRIGKSDSMTYGHAFTRWWERYGKTHPEYFALVNGKREPVHPNKPDRIKMCVSNEAFQQQIVDNWAASSPRPKFINVCENDSADYCECPKCRALDMPPRPGKKWDDDLSDRYIHFANAVLTKARKIDPEVSVCFYAYSCYRYPTRRERVLPGVILGFVPSMMSIEDTDRQYKEWRKMGAQLMFQRPNDQHVNTGLPMGFEKALFDHFQVGIKNGIIGLDYDSLHGFWDATGVADYILARAAIDPTRSFDYWMDEYCSIYGAAAPDVKEYYAYFRENVWEKRLLPNKLEILEKGRYGNFRRGLMWNLAQYYRKDDFDATDEIIARGLTRQLTERQRMRMERLKLANMHARLTFNAIAAKGDQKTAAAVKLFKFRVTNKDTLNMNWSRLFFLERSFGDIAGIGIAQHIGDYQMARTQPLRWFFMPDVDQVGDKEQWQNYNMNQIKTTWYMALIDRSWENQPQVGTPEGLFNLLKNYDGIGYYALDIAIPPEWMGKEIALVIGAADESAWIFVNGINCGDHIYKNDKDWQTPFTIPITNAVNWDQPKQTVVVKVEDRAGQGGLWRPVILVAK
ncbi:MAG: DUF4838 domain-containing protein [Victivallales bacterium]|nr:DUF4838 domain-containing protein [Victivallales bacterium]